VLLDLELTGDSKDFKPLILRARAKGAKQYVVCLDPGKSGVFARQTQELKTKSPIFGCEYLHDQDEVKAAQGALNAAWFPTVSVTDQFLEKYRKKFGNDSLISAAANHYDLAYALHDVLATKSKDDLVKRIIALGERQGAVGKFAIRSIERDQYFDIPLVIKQVSP